MFRTTKTHALPDQRVVVNPDTTLNHGDASYHGGDVITLPGPLAHELAIDGYVTIIEDQ